jgi:hypothetical protein
MQYYDRYLRWLYRAGRPNVFARMQNRASAAAFAMGIWPRRAAALDVRGRVSGRVISLPVVIVDYEGERYLVSMLGGDVNWVRNVRAAGGRPEHPFSAATWNSPQERGRTSPSTAPPLCRHSRR